MNLNAIASPAAREPGPLVTLVRCRTVAKVDSTRVDGPQMYPVLARVTVEGQDAHIAADMVGQLTAGA
jgi:hypothetical protein